MKQAVIAVGLVLLLTFIFSGGFSVKDYNEPLPSGTPHVVTLLGEGDPTSNDKTLQLRTLRFGQVTPTPNATLPPGVTPTPTSTPPTCSGQPVAVDLLLDGSGSMNYPCLNRINNCLPPGPNSKITVLKNTVKDFLTKLNPGDLVAIQAFSDGFSSVVPLQTFTDNQTSIYAKIDQSLPFGGGFTSMRQALEETTNIIIPLKNARPNYNWVLIFLTDGYPEDSGGYAIDQDPTIPTDITRVLKDPPNNLRIITIGYDFTALGTQKTIAENVLQTVASTPLSENYYQATTANLGEIYRSIATEICRGS